MTWCVAETHHLSVIQVFELQGCNVAQFVWKDLSQIAVPEGSVSIHVGGLSERSLLFWGARLSSQHGRICWWRKRNEEQFIDYY